MNFQKKLSIILLIVFLNNTVVPVASVNANRIIPEGWLRYTNNTCGFTVYLPNDYITESELGAGENIRVNLPVFEADTNLSEKYVEIECSFDPASREVDGAFIEEPSEKVFNLVNFRAQIGKEGAVGSFYQAIKYSAEQDGKYAILQFVLAAGNINNYEESVSEFEYESESVIFEEIMNTFMWGTPPPAPALQVPSTPTLAITPILTSESQACPYTSLFEEKKKIIAYLEIPQLEIEEGNSLIPLTFTKSTRGYDESWPKSVVRTLESTCTDYQNGKLTPEEKLAFEARIPAFTRLTYTEMGIKGLLPPLVQVTYDATSAYVETAVIGIQLIFSITKLADFLEENFSLFAGPVQKLKMKISYWILGTILEITDTTFKDLLDQKTRDFLDVFLLDMKISVSIGNAVEIVKNPTVKRFFTEYLISIILEDSSGINRAAQSVYPELAPGSILTVQGTDQDAYAAVQRVISAETDRANKSHQRTKTTTGVADMLQSASEAGEIVEDNVKLNPKKFIDGLAGKIKKWTTALDFFSQWLNAYATFDSGYNMIVMGDRILKMDRIAFDPNEINNLKDFRGYQPALLASSDGVVFDKNITPAPVYYSKNARRFYASVDSYDQRVQEVLNAMETGTDEQVISAIDNLMAADDEIARMLRVAKKPILGQNTNPQVNTFLASSQNFSSSNIGFQVALMLALANRTDAAVLDQVSGAAQTAVQNSNDLKEQYTNLAQPGLDLAVTPSVVIVDYEMPATITLGEQIPVKITVNNPSTSSFSGNISVRGGQVVSGTESPAGEILPGQDRVFDITLQALQAGDEIVFVDLIQNGESVDSLMMMIQIKQDDTAVILSTYGYWLAGGLGLICLFGLVTGGFVFFKYRKTARRPAKQSAKPQTMPSSTPSAAKIKRALEFARAKQYEQSFIILKEVVQSDPNNQQAWFNLGITLGYMENFKDAELCLSRARQLGHPKADEALNWLRDKRG